MIGDAAVYMLSKPVMDRPVGSHPPSAMASMVMPTSPPTWASTLIRTGPPCFLPMAGLRGRVLAVRARWA